MGEQTRNVLCSDPTVIFIIGGPGSGKGTQCTLLSKVCLVCLKRPSKEH